MLQEKLFIDTNKKITTHSAQSIGLITQHGTRDLPSLGGIILFGKNRLKLFPEAIIRCARFLGNDKETILDQADIEVFLPFAIEEAIRFVQRNTRLGAEIKTLIRKDMPEYPPIALREAIMNAVVHADYSMKGVYISVAIFDDRIEITNPGGLPFGFTLEKALAGSSRIRNRVIAKLFYHLKWIEQWGRGLHRIIKECTQAGLETPKFEEINSQFRVTLYSTKKHKVLLIPWQKELISYLKKKGAISTKQAAILWDVTSRTARVRLIKLVDVGLIRKTGTSPKDPLSEYILSNRAE